MPSVVNRDCTGSALLLMLDRACPASMLHVARSDVRLAWIAVAVREEQLAAEKQSALGSFANGLVPHRLASSGRRCPRTMSWDGEMIGPNRSRARTRCCDASIRVDASICAS